MVVFEIWMDLLVDLVLIVFLELLGDDLLVCELFCCGVVEFCERIELNEVFMLLVGRLFVSVGVLREGVGG